MDPAKDGHIGTKVPCPSCQNPFWQRRDGRPKSCSRSCARKIERDARGGRPPNWKGGTWLVSTGYRKIWKPKHHRADQRGYVLEHLVVMERKLHRRLESHEHVHHKNGKRSDNRPINLELWKTKDPRGVRASDYHCAGCRCGK